MTYTFPLTLPEARELLEQRVEERGRNFVYTSPDGMMGQCKYWHSDENKPGCGVGDVAFTAGVPAETLLQADYFSADSEIQNCKTLFPYFDVEARSYLRVFQDWQDEKYTWGDALDAAEAWAEAYLQGSLDTD